MLVLLATFVIAYFLFFGRDFQQFHTLIKSWGYIGIFISGIFLAYGFTAAPATALMLILAKDSNLFLACIIGGIGAMLADTFLFQFIKSEFKDEIKSLSHEKFVKKIGNEIPKRIKSYLAPTIAGIFIASPLPDEIGISILATITKLPIKVFSSLSFILHTLGILTILLIGKVI